MNEYLQEFIEEMLEIQQKGDLLFNGINYKIKICCVICDAPARAMVKYIKAHSGYYGCDKCVQSGVWFVNRMTFPEYNAPLHTDAAFKLMEDNRRHLNISPFTCLNLNMVSQFPIDSMHQVYLGVMRRLLHFWIKVTPSKISNLMIKQIEFALFSIRSLIPNEFARKPNSIKEYDQWKATELWQFLLYNGPVVL